ncbi:MAG: hypothetical protein LBC92_04650 [Rickettsiales bacterium]|jgi:formate hydrogenlyase subunit 3/multisubunit Na+/H+ antiporter MnhD subunit|nr:hypothetical protein [Rickettsiales bacterium]
MNNLINLPFLFLFVPLLISGFHSFQYFRITNLFIDISVLLFIILLSLYLIPDVIREGTLINRIDINSYFIIDGYKINILTLSYMILIFSLRLLCVFLYRKSLDQRHANLIFAIYAIGYFSICGILITNNIVSLFIYLEIYSISVYTIISNYREKESLSIGYIYYVNNFVGSTIFLLFFIVLYSIFSLTNISDIYEKISTVNNNFLYNSLFFVFLLSLYLKFFSIIMFFKGAKRMSSILFYNILFINFLIGSYLILKFLPVFNLQSNLILTHVICFFISILIIHSSIELCLKNNLISGFKNIFIIFAGHLFILSTMTGSHSNIAYLSTTFNCIIVMFFYYLIVSSLSETYNVYSTPIFALFVKHRYFIYFIIFSLIGFPICFGFTANYNYLMSIIEDKKYYLLFVFLVEKISFIIYLYKFNFIFTRPLKDYSEYIKLDMSLYKNKMEFFMVLFLFVFIIILSLLDINFGLFYNGNNNYGIKLI